MKISDSDKPKLIVLICLVIIVIAYGGYQIKSIFVQPVPPPVAANDRVINPAAKQQSDSVEMPMPVVTAKARDPFEPQIDTSAQSSTSKPNNKPLIKLPIFGGNNPMPVIIPSSHGKYGGGGQVVVVPEPLPNFKLVGIISGDRNLAVIKGDGNSSYMRFEGQYIEGKYLVKLISKTSVTIQYRDRITVLKLGG